MRTFMNDKEELKKAVIECCINGTMTIKVAASRLNFSERYVKKLKARYKKYGASSMIHGNCGKQPKHTIDANVKSRIWEIWNLPELEECNFTHFQEILEEDYGIKISNITLSQLVVLTAIPFTPAFAVNIAAGLSNISFKKYFVGIFLGKISLVYFWGYIGTSLVESLKNPIILVRIFFVVLVMYIISQFVNKKVNLE